VGVAGLAKAGDDNPAEARGFVLWASLAWLRQETIIRLRLEALCCSVGVDDLAKAGDAIMQLRLEIF
jgi:hypothetical protein